MSDFQMIQLLSKKILAFITRNTKIPIDETDVYKYGIEIEFNRQEDADLFAEKYKDGRRTGKVRVCCHQKTEKDMIEIMQLLTGNNISPQRIEMLEPALEDLFMEVVGE